MRKRRLFSKCLHRYGNWLGQCNNRPHTATSWAWPFLTTNIHSGRARYALTSRTYRYRIPRCVPSSFVRYSQAVSCLHVAQDPHSAQQPEFPRNRPVHFFKFCEHVYETKSPVKELVTYTRPDRANFIQCQTAQFGNTSWRPPQLLIWF
jgi:hypothetical protein